MTISAEAPVRSGSWRPLFATVSGARSAMLHGLQATVVTTAEVDVVGLLVGLAALPVSLSRRVPAP